MLVYLYYLQKKMLFICHLFFSPQCLARVKRSAGCNVDHTVHGANLCNVDHTVHGANLFVSLLHSAIFLMRSLVMKLHVFFLVL